MDLVLFMALALTSVGASIALIAHKNAVYCALFMVVVFVATSIMYVLLAAPFMAALQIIVYAGAIVVLFLFVISYLNLKEGGLRERGRFPLVLGVGMAVLLGVELIGAVAAVRARGDEATAGGLIEVPAEFGSVEAVAELLFTRYVVPFEVVSVLLIVAMVGAVVLAQRATGRVSAVAGEQQEAAGGGPGADGDGAREAVSTTVGAGPAGGAGTSSAPAQGGQR